jgi:hypothetical protein
MQLTEKEREYFTKVLTYGIEMVAQMDSSHANYVKLRAHCDIICNYVEDVKLKHSGNIQMTSREMNEFLSVINLGIELVEQLENSFHEHLKVEKENEIIYNYVSNMLTKHCIHFTYPYDVRNYNFSSFLKKNLTMQNCTCLST